MDHTVTYRFGRRDYIAALKANRALSMLGRFGRWGRYACFALFFVVLINLINIGSWSFDVVTLIVSAIMFVVMLIVAPLGEATADQLLSRLRFPQLSVANKECTLVFGEEGIRSNYGGIEGRVPWRAIVRILETNDYLLLVISRAEVILVPQRALPSADAAAELAHYIRAKVEAAASDSADTPRPVQ
jgi:hypothetical protein